MRIWIFRINLRIAALLCTILTTLASPDALAATSPFDARSFDRLGDREKQEYVLAALWDRESQLQNISYDMNDTHFRFSPKDGKTEFLTKTSIGLKRKGDKLLLRAEKLDSKGRLKQYVVNWDGSSAKSLLYRPYRDVTHSGMIRDEIDSNFKSRAYNHVLGLFLLDTPNLSLPEFLGESIAKGQPVDIKTTEEKGRRVLDVKVTRGNMYWQWFLDVERNYMPIRAEIQYRMGKNYNSDSSVVEKAIEVDGFWVPKKVFRTTGTSVSDAQSRIYYEISTFTRNTVKDEDLEVEFPPATEVVDTIANIAYRVLPGGGMELLPLYDPASGEVINPGEATSGGEVIDPGKAMTVDAALEDADKTNGAEDVAAPSAEADKPVPPKKEDNAPLAVSDTHPSSPWSWGIIVMMGAGIALFLAGLKSAKRQRSQQSRD